MARELERKLLTEIKSAMCTYEIEPRKGDHFKVTFTCPNGRTGVVYFARGKSQDHRAGKNSLAVFRRLHRALMA